MYTLWLFGIVPGFGEISANRIPLAIAADVRAAGQGDVRVIPAEERQLFRHVCGEGITIAVTAEKGGTQPVVGTQLIHAGSAASGDALQ